MSERNDDFEQKPPTNAAGTSDELAGGLPATNSPPLSPAGTCAADTSEGTIAIGSNLIPVTAVPVRRRFRLRPRHRRHAVLAASVALAALFGAAAGAFAVHRMAGSEKPSVAVREENKAMAQSIAHLAKQVSALKSDLAEAKKAARTQIAKISERADRAAATDVTGSIPVSPKAHAQATNLVPMPRPAPGRAAAVAISTPHVARAESRPAIVPNWNVRGMHRGFVYVEGHGDLFRVVPGAVLPGLGRVEAIDRRDGRWVVVTPKGLIVSQRFSEPLPAFGPPYYRDF